MTFFSLFEFSKRVNATFRKLDGTNALSNQSCLYRLEKRHFVCCLKSKRHWNLDFWVLRQLLKSKTSFCMFFSTTTSPSKHRMLPIIKSQLPSPSASYKQAIYTSPKTKPNASMLPLPSPNSAASNGTNTTKNQGGFIPTSSSTR